MRAGQRALGVIAALLCLAAPAAVAENPPQQPLWPLPQIDTRQAEANAQALREFGLSNAVYSPDCSSKVKFSRNIAVTWTINPSGAFYIITQSNGQHQVAVLSATIEANGTMRDRLRDKQGEWSNINEKTSQGWRTIWTDMDGKPDNTVSSTLKKCPDNKNPLFTNVDDCLSYVYQITAGDRYALGNANVNEFDTMRKLVEQHIAELQAVCYRP